MEHRHRARLLIADDHTLLAEAYLAGNEAGLRDNEYVAGGGS